MQGHMKDSLMTYYEDSIDSAQQVGRYAGAYAQRRRGRVHMCLERLRRCRQKGDRSSELPLEANSRHSN
eukprot:6189203-Pleurochrysis_carterae.AAC.1